jgi:CheY-like chemotaxis protein
VFLNKSINQENVNLKEPFSIDNYEKIINNSKYENGFIGECKIISDKEIPNKQSLIIFVSKFLYVLIFEYKAITSESDNRKIFDILKLIQQFLSFWQNIPNSKINDANITSSNFLLKTTTGLVKEIKTISGLLTLINEEQLSNSVNNYFNEIKIINQSMLESIDDFSSLVKLNSLNITKKESKFYIKDVLDNTIKRINSGNTKLNYSLNNNVFDELYYYQDSLSEIIYDAVNFISKLAKSKNIQIDLDVNTNNKLKIGISTESLNISEEKLSNFLEPFENKDYSKNQSGLSLTLLSSKISRLNGEIRVDDDNKHFNLYIMLPVKLSSESFKNNINEKTTTENKDKVLVIESDNYSSILLRNHLTRWNYKTEIVNSGSYALQLIKENHYVAVILNVDQESENSLELLQKIKNHKSTRNTPVIVFSLEAEKEKIYLMGSVDYLVKPINYNNLIEILTSYRLRRNSTVLCVDDDKPTLNLLKQAVSTAGFNVIAEHRPELVMDLIIEKELDLAIIDLDMPKINGFDLIKNIKSHEKFSKLPIIIYTGKENYQEDLQNIDGLFVDLLEKKSTSFNELEKTIMDMIKSYEEPKKIDDVNSQSMGPKILMAEDYKHSQIIVTRLLKKSGFENVIVVENGEEALNICEGDKIDLILMDMQMPVMNGFEATGKIRALEGYADTPIISLTAFAMKGDREKCLEAGATDYIPKPIDSKEFIEKVKYYTQLVLKV